jgi:hypothetical protein
MTDHQSLDQEALNWLLEWSAQFLLKGVEPPSDALSHHGVAAGGQLHPHLAGVD